MSSHQPLDELLDPRLARGWGGTFYGVYAAVVTDLADPDGQGRVRVRLPWSPDAGGSGYEAWARLATLMAGADRGSWFIPDVDDEVLVAFEAGDPRRPYVVGALWNGSDSPPETMDGAGNNDKKVLKSRAGVTVTLDDTSGAESLSLETPGGQKVVLEDGAGSIEMSDANGNSIKLEAAGITINAAAELKITAGAKVSIQAGAPVEIVTPQLTANAAMLQVSGVAQVATLIANAVVSSSYTPGAGNTLGL